MKFQQLRKKNKMDDKLSYEDWRKTVTITSPIEVITELKETHGINFFDEIEEVLRYDYQVYLCGGHDAVMEHNRLVLDMQCDPSVDPKDIPPIWPVAK